VLAPNRAININVLTIARFYFDEYAHARHLTVFYGTPFHAQLTNSQSPLRHNQPLSHRLYDSPLLKEARR
jgi:hypothetical protein